LQVFRARKGGGLFLWLDQRIQVGTIREIPSRSIGVMRGGSKECPAWTSGCFEIRTSRTPKRGRGVEKSIERGGKRN